MAEGKSGYKIKIRRKAEKELYKIPFPWQRRIVQAINALGKDPFYGEKMWGKLKDRRKIRIWPYRIIYRVYNRQKIIYIERISYRQVAYK
jgi:mRNA-degrading endonuclease RelE of RelBE toxin-antitoxin system